MPEVVEDFSNGTNSEEMEEVPTANVPAGGGGGGGGGSNSNNNNNKGQHPTAPPDNPSSNNNSNNDDSNNTGGEGGGGCKSSEATHNAAAAAAPTPTFAAPTFATNKTTATLTAASTASEPVDREEALAELQRVFDRYDVAHTGQIDQREMVTHLLPDMGIASVSEDDLLRVMEEIDMDGDGFVDFEEFVQFYEVLKTVLSKEGRVDEVGDVVQILRETKKKAHDAYLTERQIRARERIYGLLYDLPCFAPDYLWRRWWDVVVLLLLVYCVVVPTVTATLTSPPSVNLFISDLLVSVFLTVDVFVNINTAVQEEDSFALVLSRRKIIRHYFLKGLMPIDVLAAIPWDHMMYWVTRHTGSATTVYTVFCFVRCLKVLKYPYLFHLTNRGTMDPAFVRFYFWNVPLFRLFFKMIIIGHCLTITRLLISMTLKDEDCDTFGRDACAQGIFARYFFSFFWVWSLLTTQGTAALESTASFVYASFVMLFSLLLQGHVVASMSAIILKSNVEAQNQDSMRGTLAIMKHYRIPAMLQQEVLSFQFHSLQQNAAASLAHTLERLPPAMQREVGLYVKVDLVTNVPMFQDLSSEARLAVANCLEQTFAEPYDFIISHGEEGAAMYFMMHGFADVIVPPKGETPEDELVDMGHSGKQGRIVATIIRGDFFGEIALLKPELKRTASIQALTYCNLFRLDFRDVQRLFKVYDDIQVRLEQEAASRGLLTTNTTSAQQKVEDDEQVYAAHRRKSLLTNSRTLGYQERRLSESANAAGVGAGGGGVGVGGGGGYRRSSTPSHPRLYEGGGGAGGSEDMFFAGPPGRQPQPPPPPPPQQQQQQQQQHHQHQHQQQHSESSRQTLSPLATPLTVPMGTPASVPPPVHLGRGGGGGGSAMDFHHQQSTTMLGESSFGFGHMMTEDTITSGAPTAAGGVDLAPFLKKAFSILTKHLEQGNEKLCRGVSQEMRSYSGRIDEMERRIDDILYRLDHMTRGREAPPVPDTYTQMFGETTQDAARRTTAGLRWH